MKRLLILANLLILNISLFVFVATPKQPVMQEVVITAPTIHELPNINYEISDPIPSYLDYDRTVAQLQKWREEAPELVKIGTYGKTSKGQNIYYIKICNQRVSLSRPVVLITACIHGNEPLSSSAVMGYIGTILDKYGDDPRITNLVDNRTLYFVPVVSPDSYPHSRHVNGVDPNRNFPTTREPDRKSVPPIAALQKFFLEIKPNAVISGHTSGRVFLTPWGDQTRLCPNDDDYKRIVGKMTDLSSYRMQRACQMYGHPIYGTEVDWYYRNGAFAIVMEFGTHQRIPSIQDINTEFNRTFEAVLYFIEEAPEVEIKFFVEQDWKKAA